MKQCQMARHGFEFFSGVRTFGTLTGIFYQLTQLVHKVPADVITAVLFVKSLKKAKSCLKFDVKNAQGIAPSLNLQGKVD